MDLTPYELTMRLEEFWKAEERRQKMQLELTALHAVWIINSSRTKEDPLVSVDMLLGRTPPEEDKTTTRDDYDELIRHIEGVN